MKDTVEDLSNDLQVITLNEICTSSAKVLHKHLHAIAFGNQEVFGNLAKGGEKRN